MGSGKDTYIPTDIATTKKNWPRGQFFENMYIYIYGRKKRKKKKKPRRIK